MAYRTAERPPGTCPRCDRNLRLWGTASERYERCFRCNGVFMDEQTLGALCAEISPASHAPPLRAPAPTTEPRRRCPLCRDPMEKVEPGYDRRSEYEPLLLDRCGAHGIWFDALELEALLVRAKKSDAAAELRGSLLEVDDTSAASVMRGIVRFLFWPWWM